MGSQPVDPWPILPPVEKRTSSGHGRHGAEQTQTAFHQETGENAALLSRIHTREPPFETFQMDCRQANGVVIVHGDDRADHMSPAEFATAGIADQCAIPLNAVECRLTADQPEEVRAVGAEGHRIQCGDGIEIGGVEFDELTFCGGTHRQHIRHLACHWLTVASFTKSSER